MRKTTLTLLVACAGLFAWLYWVPLAGKATVCVDDFAWLLMAHGRPTLSEAIVASWSEYMFFRPLDVVANRLVDPRTLDLAPIVPIQMAGLLALTAGMCRLITVSSGHDYRAWAFAALWLWLHPSTQLSIWSAGASSQTWSAAAGIWLLCEVLGEPPSDSRQWTALFRTLSLSAIGIFFKESFVGWATAAALVALIRTESTGGTKGEPSRWIRLLRAAPTVASILGPSVVWIFARTAASTFGDLVLTHDNPHYSFQPAAVIAKNTSIALLGMFVQGPVHWARLLPAPWLIVPFVGAALSAMIAVQGSRKARRLARMFFGISPLVTCSVLGLIAVWPALLIKHVSELYLMGSNALIGMLFGIGASATLEWPSKDIAHKANSAVAGMTRATAMRAALVLLAATAVAGALSRAYHFNVTWAYAQAMRAEALSIAGAPPRICIDERLRQGPMHSKYIVPPAVAAVLPSTFQARRLVDPDFPNPTFECSDSDASGDTVVLNPRLPQRVMW